MATLEEVQFKLDTLISNLRTIPENLTVTGRQVAVTSLSEVSERLGLIRAGEFRAGNSNDPGKGFTGVRIGFPPFSYNQENWNVVGVNGDILQFGLNADNGKAYFGGGAAIIDADGIALPQGHLGTLGTYDTSAIKWTNSSDNLSSYIQDANYSGGTGLYIDHKNWASGAFILTMQRVQDDGTIYYDTYLGSSNFFSMERNAAGTSGSVEFNFSGIDVDFLVYGDNGLILQTNGAEDRLEIMNVGSTAVHILDGAGTSYFNEPNNDVDVIFEGTTDSHLMHFDAGLDAIGVGGVAIDTFKLAVYGSLSGSELSADPDDPAEGRWVLWQSDGTGSGDDGDIMIKITAGATTKTATLVDFSTIP